MIDLVFVLESLKRRWYVLLVAIVLATGCGMVTASSSASEAPVSMTYTAEATIYVDGYRTEDVNEYNYQVNEGWLSNDARRIVLSDSVAGEVRRQLGDEVTLATPYWVDQKTQGNISTHFVFVNASAPSEEQALDAAQMAADLACERIQEQLNAGTVSLYEDAVIKTASTERAGDYGVDALEPTIATTVASSFSVKKVAVFVVAGLAVACVVVVLFDFLHRRVRTAHDVERLLGVPLLGSFGAKGDSEASVALAAASIDIACRKNDVKTVAVCGLCEQELTVAKTLAASLADRVAHCTIVEGAVLSSGAGATPSISDADCVVLVVGRSMASASQIGASSDILHVVDLPVLGAFFVEGKEGLK